MRVRYSDTTGQEQPDSNNAAKSSLYHTQQYTGKGFVTGEIFWGINNVKWLLQVKKQICTVFRLIIDAEESNGPDPFILPSAFL